MVSAYLVCENLGTKVEWVDGFLGRAQLLVESAFWSHAHVVVMEDPPPPTPG